MSFTNSLLLRRYCDLVVPSDSAEPPASEKSAFHGKILVAETDPSDLEHLASILRNLGFTVMTAQDGATALDLVGKDSPELVLSSLELPKIDGYKLCQAMKASRGTEGIPFMFILPAGEFPDHLIGHESYAHDYIQKPISVPELSSRIRSLLSLTAKSGPSDSTVRHPPATRFHSTVGTSDPSGDQEDTVGGGCQEKTSSSQIWERIRDLLEALQQSLEQLRSSGYPVEEAVRTPDLFDSDQVSPPPSSNRGSGAGALLEALLSRELDEERSDRRPESKADLEESERGPCSDFFVRKEERWFLNDSAGRPPAKMEGDSERGFSEVKKYLAKNREKIDLRSLSEEAEGTSLGVEDLFNEFFESESATRSERESLSSSKSDVGASQQEDELDGLYEEATSYVLDWLQLVKAGDKADIARGAAITERMVSSIGENTSLVMAATDREQDFAISLHSVNVAVFGIRIAQSLNCDLLTQHEVGLAALLHELGVTELPDDLLYQVNSPSREQMKLMRERPLYSARILQNLGPEYSWLGEIVEQVYERENGRGYPRGLKREELCQQARIIGIADVFDACIHKRPYRAPLTGYQSLFELTTDQQKSFSDKMVKALIRTFSLYPYNECVRMSTGETGRVVDINPKNLSRPVVRILYDRSGKALPLPMIVDLAKDASLYISEALRGTKCL